MDLRTALLQGQKLLEDDLISVPRLTAEVLLAHAIGCERVWLFAHFEEELREVWWIHYGRYLHQRLNGVPTQYITGRQEFFGRDFLVTRDVLIPRPDTEHLVEAAIARAKGARVIADIGTGSGAIGITLALEISARVIATDISGAALRIASENAKKLNASIDLVNCDLASALTAGAFDLVVSNPPYVPETDRDGLQREVRENEPEVALFGGEDGLRIYRRLIPDAARLIRPGGWLIMEVGYRVADAVIEMLEGWSDITIINDCVAAARRT